MDRRTTLQRNMDVTPKPYQICIPIAGLYKTPSPHSRIDTQLIFGCGFEVYEIADGWAYGQEIVSDAANYGGGYVGYVPMEALVPTRYRATHKIITLRAPVFSKSDLKSPIRKFLPLNACVHQTHEQGDYRFLQDVGWVHERHLSADNNSHIHIDMQDSADFVEIAELHFGLPYVWGGTSSDGLDCSGLVQTALRGVGKDAPRDADMQENMLGQSLPIRDDLSGLLRGDLVFWKGHVGIMGDPEMLLHANAYHMGVAIEPLTIAVERIAKSVGPITAIKRL